MPRAQEGTVRVKPSLPVLTVGHSTQTIETFVALPKAHGVRRVIDVRTIPRLRHNPSFTRRRCPGYCAWSPSSTSTWPGWVACAALAPTHGTRAGATPRSVDMPTICRRLSLKNTKSR